MTMHRPKSHSDHDQADPSHLMPEQELEQIRMNLGRNLLEQDRKNRLWAQIEKIGKTLMKRARRGLRLED